MILQNITEFAKNKISSNVVEKCFSVVTSPENIDVLRDIRHVLIATVLGQDGDDNAPIHHIMNDKFGNYIVQSIIKYSRGFDQEDQQMLQRRLDELEPKLKDSTTGKHILAAYKKEYS